MYGLSQSQKDIKRRITQSIETEIGMCDDYADLLVLAAVIFESSRNIFTAYQQTYGDEALDQSVDLIRKHLK